MNRTIHRKIAFPPQRQVAGSSPARVRALVSDVTRFFQQRETHELSSRLLSLSVNSDVVTLGLSARESLRSYRQRSSGCARVRACVCVFGAVIQMQRVCPDIQQHVSARAGACVCVCVRAGVFARRQEEGHTHPPKEQHHGGGRSIRFFLSFFVLLLPHRDRGRCFFFSFARSVRHLPARLFLHLSHL